jgi:RNA polymerase sigma factor (sigma-70 family)
VREIWPVPTPDAERMDANHPHRRRPQVRPPRRTTACSPLSVSEVATLVAHAAAGEVWAWTALIVRFRPVATAVARRHRLSPDDCEEVAQRTWLRLLGAIERLDRPAQLGAWVATTARHESLRLLGQRREEPVEAPPEPGVVPDADGDVTAEECREALDRALAAVPARQRELMRLLMRDPTPSYEQISRALGIPIGSIGPTRARCIARLRTDRRLARAVGATAIDCGRPAPPAQATADDHDH